MHTNPTFWWHWMCNLHCVLCTRAPACLLVPCLLNDFNDLFGIRNRGVVVFGHDLTQPSMHSMQPTKLRTTDSAHHLNLKLYTIFPFSKYYTIQCLMHACMHASMYGRTDGWDSLKMILKRWDAEYFVSLTFSEWDNFRTREHSNSRPLQRNIRFSFGIIL